MKSNKDMMVSQCMEVNMKVLEKVCWSVMEAYEVENTEYSKPIKTIVQGIKCCSGNNVVV